MEFLYSAAVTLTPVHCLFAVVLLLSIYVLVNGFSKSHLQQKGSWSSSWNSFSKLQILKGLVLSAEVLYSVMAALAKHLRALILGSSQIWQLMVNLLGNNT